MSDGVSNSMFWVGAMMVAAPIVFFGTVIGIWWYVRKKERDQSN